MAMFGVRCHERIRRLDCWLWTVSLQVTSPFPLCYGPAVAGCRVLGHLVVAIGLEHEGALPQTWDKSVMVAEEQDEWLS